MQNELDDVREARQLIERLPSAFAARPEPDSAYGPGWHARTKMADVEAGDGVNAEAPLSAYLGLWFGAPSMFSSREPRIVRLFRIVGSEFSQLRHALKTTETYRDVDTATGATLDMIGRNVRQWRGALPDETYRVLIKGKILRSLSRGDTNSIIRALSATLGAPLAEIRVVPLWHASNPEPAAVMITTSTEALVKVGLTPSQFVEIAQSVVAAGVRVQSLFEGTFTFAGGPDEFDYDAGFADVDQTVGGTLGEWYDPGSAPPLPVD